MILRPGIQALVEDAQRGMFEMLVAEALDRVSHAERRRRSACKTTGAATRSPNAARSELCKQLRQQTLEQLQFNLNQLNSTTYPAPSSPEVQRIRAPLPRRHADAAAMRKEHNRFHMRQGTRKTCAKTVRQGAERHPAVSAIPARYPNTRRRLAAIRTVSPLTATRIQTNKTTRGRTLASGHACLTI